MKKSVLRLAVGGSLLVAGAVAHADVVLPSTGNGEIVLFVFDATTNQSYARGIQVLVDTVLPSATIQPSATYTGAVTTSYVLPTVTADSNLTAFLGGAGATTNHAGDSFTWGLQGGGIGIGQAPGSNIYVTTTTKDLTNAANVVNTSQITVGYNSLEASLNTVNGQIVSGVTFDGASTAAGKDGIWGGGSTQDMQGWFGNGPNTAIAIGHGNPSQLFALTGNGKNQTAQVYLASQQIELLANGTLESVPAAVPLPAAIWLLGSGLLGLAGIGRRRAVSVTNAA